MKFDFWDFLIFQAFAERSRRKKAQGAINPGKKKPRILPIVLGMFACQFIAMIVVYANIKSLNLILNVVNIILWILLIRAIIIRVKRK